MADEPEEIEPGGFGDDPATDHLLAKWVEVDHHETVEPTRDWSVLFALVVVVAVAGLLAAAHQLITRGDDSGPNGADSAQDDGVEGRSVLDREAPSLEDLTSDVTLPPGPDAGLAVVEKGVTIVEDRFDADRREGTFAVIIQNPNSDWLAQGVQVTVTFQEPGGTPVGSDNAFVEVVLPDQRVAVASLFFDAPTVPVADLAVDIDVARWRETDPFVGGFTTTDVVTEEAEFSGVRTTFLLRSSFPERLTDVGVTAVYRAPDGRIVGGYDTFVELVDAGVDTPVEIALLANIPVEEIAATELYPYAGFGFVPDGG